MGITPTLLQLGAAALATAGLAASEANPFFYSDLTENAGIEKRQGGSFLAITGATNSQDVQPRLEIRQLQQNADAWNLFLLAMRDFKGMNQNPDDSYYSISGIHGVPNVPWNGVTGNGGGTGYCTHVSPLFPAWHRAYMALFEQAFVDHVQTIVNQFSGDDQQRYSAAASTLRFPYWDWAASPADGSTVLPPSMTDLNANMNGPNGPFTDLNPLFRYDFHPLDHAGLVWDPWDNWQVTLRYPKDETPQSGDDNPQAVTVMQNDQPGLQGRVYNLMTQCNLYEGFSNADASQRPPQCVDSLEDIHNNIHNDVGGAQSGHQGHMAIIPLASFDPAFWLHHMNVDRLYALWQGIYPEQYTIDGTMGAPTYYYSQGTRCGPDTALAPFSSNPNGAPHTSNSVRNTSTFLYTYPEFISGDTSSDGITAKVNALYGGGSTSPSKRDSPYEPTEANAKRSPQSLSDGLKSLTNAVHDLPSDLARQLTPTGRGPFDYLAKVTIQPYSLGGSARVFLFLGEPASEDPSTWHTDASCVGWVGTFASPGMNENTLTQSSVPLTAALLKQQANGIIPGISPNQTMPLLTKQLNWRVSGPNGVIAPEDVPGLTVGVHSAPVTPAKSLTEFPKFGNYTTHQSVTNGKAGGVQNGMSGDWFTQFLKVGRVAIITRGRYAGKKVVIIQPYDNGSKTHPFPHALVAGIERYPQSVTRRMSKTRINKRSKVKPFIKVVNYNHIMPTRYTLELEGLKGVVSNDTFKEVSAREDAKKNVKKVLEERYTSGKNRWFFTPLRF
ncbi:MAG: hypothetical protein Q9162_002139 [Coniocarpon cinnabarinum]